MTAKTRARTHRPRKLSGAQCPVACGHCCELWREVVEGPGPECPNMGEHGCELDRASRPHCCRTFFCDTARMVLSGKKTRTWGRWMSSRRRHYQGVDRWFDL